ncbi:DUF4367 domain-containing protein [Oceanobacillus alkalisoli]|uniref:DUF4367 domain-containing protein n=1 Tax=Oceanobacillus alkalisoli TaxID=2925113 RepID=UPI001EEFF8F8|nr:DUF4367 domain-containing protein [Oceanobacillus alkalisoli]MCF3944225.1 DUF4367 domain-containing protein [Oceanobacillus alkalisoli]MCG5103164.1 DUF4367 domain-containing protein [Oceanobacillus alkalisoli]
MKKTIVLLLLASLLLLAACGEDKEQLNVSEVLEQAIQANADLESYSTDMKIDTEVMEMEMTIEGSADITHNPDTLYLDMAMGMAGISMDIETYVVGEEVYMSMFGEWLIMDDEEMGLDNFDQLNQEELDKLESFVDQFEMTEEDEVYVLRLAGEGEEFEKLIEPYLDATMGDLAMDVSLEEEDFSDLSISNFETEMKVDKETMLVQSQTVQAEFEMDGEAYQVNAEVTMSNMNEVEPIEIPEEVKESAVTEADWEEDLGFVEEEMSLEEIKETVDYTIPDLSFVPDGYELTESYYYSDDESEMVYLIYEDEDRNGVVFSIYPSQEDYGEVYEDEETETVSVNGNEAVLEVIDEEFMYLTWEYEDVFLELIGEGTEMTKKLLLQIAEGIE